MAAPTLSAWLLGSRLCTSEQLGTWGPTNTIDHVHWKGLGLEVQLGLDVALAMANARNIEKPLVNVAAETVPEVYLAPGDPGCSCGPTTPASCDENSVSRGAILATYSNKLQNPRKSHGTIIVIIIIIIRHHFNQRVASNMLRPHVFSDLLCKIWLRGGGGGGVGQLSGCQHLCSLTLPSTRSEATMDWFPCQHLGEQSFFYQKYVVPADFPIIQFSDRLRAVLAQN